MRISASTLLQIANAIHASIRIKQTLASFQHSMQNEHVAKDQISLNLSAQVNNKSIQRSSTEYLYEIIKTLCEYCPEQHKGQMSKAYEAANTYNMSYRKVKEKLYYRNQSNPLDMSCEILKAVTPVLNVKKQAAITKLIRIYDILKS